jgi:hypothetical protein
VSTRNDTVIRECSEPATGQWVSRACEYGGWNLAGRDTLILNCTDTADLQTGAREFCSRFSSRVFQPISPANC